MGLLTLLNKEIGKNKDLQEAILRLEKQNRMLREEQDRCVCQHKVYETAHYTRTHDHS
jgi:hypothetical protein